MPYSTYSFNDVHVVISPPGFPAYTLNGQGVGDINISFADDNTLHDRSADGRVMVSKIKANNGSISISVQQTSALHKYLKQLFNFLRLRDTSAWAGTMITLSSPAGLFDTITATGVSFSKRADQPYQAQGQNVTWNFMAADIQYVI